MANYFHADGKGEKVPTSSSSKIITFSAENFSILFNREAAERDTFMTLDVINENFITGYTVTLATR